MPQFAAQRFHVLLAIGDFVLQLLHPVQVFLVIAGFVAVARGLAIGQRLLRIGQRFLLIGQFLFQDLAAAAVALFLRAGVDAGEAAGRFGRRRAAAAAAVAAVLVLAGIGGGLSRIGCAPRMGTLVKVTLPSLSTYL